MTTTIRKTFTLCVALTLIGLFASTVHARGFAGWGIYYGSIAVHADLSGLRGSSTKPQIGVVDAKLYDIKYYCGNPQSDPDSPSYFNVSPGEASYRHEVVASLIDGGLFDGNGQGTFDLKFEIPELLCVNDNWVLIDGTDVAERLEITITWYDCSGNTNKEADGNACYEPDPNDPTRNILTVKDKVVDDVVTGECTLTYTRDDNFEVIPATDEFGNEIPLEYVCIDN